MSSLTWRNGADVLVGDGSGRASPCFPRNISRRLVVVTKTGRSLGGSSSKNMGFCSVIMRTFTRKPDLVGFYRDYFKLIKNTNFYFLKAVADSLTVQDTR